ncbi:phage major capsid protein [[Mycobacterium] wendilense]|uniref:Phage major capsid protein n=1 Tax=[Mycobacterium] wendilense TaxID=3064284 RepID=A0ABM9M8G9_9MYCO|nr:phage major capsid protein [Mycolicibacterium sp. MU0050]CAJ1578977.1 phage major capsid protein [Mycolicibacterium sp. MU0050]
MAQITTSTADYAWRPDQTFFPAPDVVAPALILQTSTVAGSVDGDQPAVRVAFVKDADSAAYVAEGSPATEDDPDLDELEVRTKKLVRLVNLSSEQFRQTQTATQVAESVARDLVSKADNSYIADVGGPTGLTNVSNIINGGELGNNLDILVDLIAEIESNGGTPSHIVMHPQAFAEVKKLKTESGSNASLVGAGVTDAVPMLLSLPVLKSRYIPAGNGLVVDRTAIVSAVGPVSVATSEHALFASDGVQLRATWRIGWGVTRPDRIGKFTVDGS